jgi:acyl-CoA reductase-like NAD-dependent aldehyde dehydrogenase
MSQLDVRNPRTGEVDYRIAPPDAAAVAALAGELRAAQPAWAAAGFTARCEALKAWSDSLLAAPGALLDALSMDTGRHLIAQAELYALPGMVARWSAAAPRLLDESGQRDSATAGVIVRDQLVPYGLVGVISPWNFPFLLSMIDAIPALAAGCAVVVKPSEVTPRFVEPLQASIAAVPELAAVFRFVQGDGTTGSAVIDNVDAIAFTGSVRTGRLVAEACARRFIPAFLELGGKDPCVVLPSADPVLAARTVLRASVQATGQACQSLERIYVPAARFDEFVTSLVAQAKAVELSYPDSRTGHLGPLIFARQADIIADHLADARAKGARVLCGGEIETHGGGRWVRPTVVVDVTHDMKLMRDETFGPVIPVMAYADLDEAVALANDTDYGLSAAVLGGDPAECEAVARRLNAGAVSINDGAMTVDVHDATHDAFGYSGMGISRMGDSGLTRYLRRKALLIRATEPRSIRDLDERLSTGT